MTGPWDLTEPQRRQFREAQAAAKTAPRICKYQQEVTAEGPEPFYLLCELPEHPVGTLHWDEADDIWFLPGREKVPGEVALEEADLRVDAWDNAMPHPHFRASARITHLPSGAAGESGECRSGLQAKAGALTALRQKMSEVDS